MNAKRVIIFLLIFGFLGYSREFFFVNLNNIMYEKFYGHTDLPVPGVMGIFTNFSYKTLYYSKYLYTLLWIFLFFSLNYIAIRTLSGEKKLARFLVYSYLLLLFLAAVSMVYGYFVNNRLQDDEYTISRWLLGIAQSPIICLILLASEKLYNQTSRS